MLIADYRKIRLRFKETAVTSRARMRTKLSYVVRVYYSNNPGLVGVGECPLFEGLSAEDTPDFEKLLREACAHPENLPEISSIRFAFESAMADLRGGGRQLLADTSFTEGKSTITINGLVWMGDRDTMARRIREKLDAGFLCVKLKIGGIDFEDELGLLALIRREFGPDDIELRLDANGAFSVDNALGRIKRLSEYHIHSIEQPLKAGQWEAMAQLCSVSPIPIALDEELIGFSSDRRKHELLETIRPAYVILKPALCGGFAEADRWIDIAEKHGIGWWATSALESNIGLGAIAQWVSRRKLSMPQGLGTGALYVENFPTALSLHGDKMCFDPAVKVSSDKIWAMAENLYYDEK